MYKIKPTFVTKKTIITLFFQKSAENIVFLLFYGVCLPAIFSSLKKSTAVIIIIIGKTEDTAKPTCRSVTSAIIPKSHGPMQQPISPHIAKTLNITASPLGNARLPAERVPGQKRLTVKPQSAQAESASIGLFENAAT